MKITVDNQCAEYASYRATRVQSLFNVENANRFSLAVNLPIDTMKWSVGLVVGPSGSGKTSIGRQVFGRDRFATFKWPKDQPIIDAIGPNSSFEAVTAALSAVGLGSVPSWLRPYHVLSNGEQFRAQLARVVCDKPREVVIDEFTSVVDRQVAKVGASAFAKAWRRSDGQAVLLSCHYDIIEWLQPDWTLDTSTGEFSARCHRCRPPIEIDIRHVGWEWWPHFEPHHYLKASNAIAARCYVAFVDGRPVAHMAMSTRPGLREARACRLVVMPEWQGIGVGLAFLNAVCAAWRRGANPYAIPMPTLINTSHHGLASALRKHPHWAQVSASLFGSNKRRSAETIATTAKSIKAGYGGHFRAIQGFRYVEGHEVRL